MVAEHRASLVLVAVLTAGCEGSISDARDGAVSGMDAAARDGALEGGAADGARDDHSLASREAGPDDASADASVGDASFDDAAASDAAEDDAGGAVDAAIALDAGPRCRPVVVRQFSMPADVSLLCASSPPAVVLEATVPEAGRALAFARLRVAYPGSDIVHFWSASVAVGAPIAAYAVGDDVCPNRVVERATMGLGVLSASASTVRLYVHQGSNPCTDGTLRVLAGSTLDVFVEDPACPNEQIAFGSYYASHGVVNYFDWATVMTPLPGATATLATERAGERVRVLGVVEGSPHVSPNNACGSENPDATLVMQSTLDGSVVETTTDVIPASQGMGHIVLSSGLAASAVRAVAPGSHTASMLVGSNVSSRVTTGGCCGDGAIALVRLD